MSVDRQRWRWSVGCFAALIGVFLVLVLNETWWAHLGVFHLRPYFADTVAILAAGQAQEVGRDVFLGNPFDPFGRPHVYGAWWLVTGPLGLVVRDAWWLGAALGVAFAVTALVLMAPRTAREAAVAFLLLVSPPVLLGIERANNDLVIFLLLAFAAAGLARSHFAAGASGVLTLVLAAVLKFYPLAALGAVLVRRERLPRLALMLIAALALFAVLWWMQREAFFRALAVMPRPDTLYAYGVRVLSISWTSAEGARLWLATGLLVGVTGAWWLLWPVRAAITRALPEDGVIVTAAVAGGACWLFCYVANTNYAYRAVLLVLVAPLWLQLARSADIAARALGWRASGLLLVTLWSALPKYHAIESLRAQGGTSAPLRNVTLAVCGLEQGLVLATSALLLVALAAWTWRRLGALKTLG